MGYFCSKMGAKGRRGQAMTEYIIVFVVLVFLAYAFATLLYTLRQNSKRTLDLVASEYP